MGEAWKARDRRLDRIVAINTLKGPHTGRFEQEARSLGAVLYEPMSGERAFAGESAAEVLSAILRDEPQPLEAPEALGRIIMRCLRKLPADRFQRMRDVRMALEN